MSKKNKQLIRDVFRDAVFKRDEYKCVMCGKAQNSVPLNAHHITDRHEMSNGGYVVQNGITLCDVPGGCHWKAEAFHREESSEDGFLPSELYDKIGSNHYEALCYDELNK